MIYLSKTDRGTGREVARIPASATAFLAEVRQVAELREQLPAVILDQLRATDVATAGHLYCLTAEPGPLWSAYPDGWPACPLCGNPCLDGHAGCGACPESECRAVAEWRRRPIGDADVQGTLDYLAARMKPQQ
jgi:hypothetical protein